MLNSGLAETDNILHSEALNRQLIVGIILHFYPDQSIWRS